MPNTLEKRGGKTALPASEQAVVDEFAFVIRKHLDQNPITLAHLARLAFGISIKGRASRQVKARWRSPGTGSPPAIGRRRKKAAACPRTKLRGSSGFPRPPC